MKPSLVTHFISFLLFAMVHHTLTYAETLVTAPRPRQGKLSLDMSSTDLRVPAAWTELFESGLQATPISGPLSPSSIRFRGFSSHQLSVDVDGYTIADSGTGLIDPNDLPFFASTSAAFLPGTSNDALGGRLTIDMSIPSDRFFRSQATFGLRRFGQINFLQGSGAMASHRILSGIQLSSHAGNYPFRLPYADDQDQIRRNNDQSRMIALFKSQHDLSGTDLEFLTYFRHHEGGLPGPAPFPSSALRLMGQKFLFGAGLFFDLGSYPIEMRFHSKVNATQVRDLDVGTRKHVTFVENNLKLTASRKFSFADTFASLGGFLSSSHVLGSDFQRLSTGLLFNMQTSPFQFWNMRFTRSGSFDFHSDAGWFLGFSTDISANPIDGFTFGLRFGKKSRPPTLSEMFAPQGVVLSNPNLEPEKVYDAGLYFSYDISSFLRFDVDLYYAYLAKMIIYVNKNSYFLQPVNADKVHRGGFSFGATYEPFNFLSLSLKSDLLLSHLKDTGANIPGATPYAMTLSTRIGELDKIHAKVQGLVNTGSSSNLFGTLRTKPYLLLNTSIHLPINKQTDISLKLTNLLDNKMAQSQYQYPMPGFEIFATLEFKS